MMSQGETYTYTFTASGTFPYRCGPHPDMLGTVTVVDMTSVD